MAHYTHKCSGFLPHQTEYPKRQQNSHKFVLKITYVFSAPKSSELGAPYPTSWAATHHMLDHHDKFLFLLPKCIIVFTQHVTGQFPSSCSCLGLCIWKTTSKATLKKGQIYYPGDEVPNVDITFKKEYKGTHGIYRLGPKQNVTNTLFSNIQATELHKTKINNIINKYGQGVYIITTCRGGIKSSDHRRTTVNNLIKKETVKKQLTNNKNKIKTNYINGEEIEKNIVQQYFRNLNNKANSLTNNENNNPRQLGSYRKGGQIKKTGLYKLHKGEVVVPAYKVKTVDKALKNAGKKKLKKTCPTCLISH